MSQHELNREISRATGESVSTIAGIPIAIPMNDRRLTNSASWWYASE